MFYLCVLCLIIKVLLSVISLHILLYTFKAVREPWFGDRCILMILAHRKNYEAVI